MSVRTLLRRAWGHWEAWWFRPTAAATLGLLRIAFGALALGSHVALWPMLGLLFGAEGPMPLPVAISQGRATRFSLLDYAPDLLGLQALHVAGGLVLLLWTLGWRTRWTGLLSALVLISLHHRNLWFQHGGDRVIRIAVLMLAVAPAGAALSLDARRQQMRRLAAGLGACSPLVAVWPLRLFQLQWAVIYLYTGVAKLRGANWRDGSALYYALSDQSFQRFPQWVEPLLQSPLVQALGRALTWSTLAWEVAFAPLMVWPVARLPMLWVGVGIHLGIATTISVGSFSFAMMAGYLAFLSPAAVQRRLATGLASWRRRGAEGAPGT